MALATMIKEYWIPSTGLHGLPLFIGSYFGEFVLASLSAGLNIEVYQLYAFIVPFFALPLLLYSFFYFLNNRHLYLLMVILFAPFSFSNHPWMGFDLSILFSYLFLFCLFLNLRDNRLFFSNLLIVFLTFWAKFNVGFIAFGLISYDSLYYLRSNKKRLLLYWGLLFICLAGVFKLFFPVLPGSSNGFSWWWYYLFTHRSQVHLGEVFEFIWNFMSLPLCYYLCASVLYFQKEAHWLRKNHLSAILVSGMLVGAFLALHLVNLGNSNIHFFQVAQLMSAPLIIACLDKIRIPSGLRNALGALSLILLSFSLFERLKEFSVFEIIRKKALSDFIVAFDANLLGNEESKKQKFLPYIENFKIIDTKVPKNFLVEIPEDLVDFWQHSIFKTSSVRHWMAFYIPIFAKRPAWKGYNDAFMKGTNVAWYPPGYYGYNAYYKQQAKNLCTDTSFDGIAAVSNDIFFKAHFNMLWCNR